jgi:hypothetical protein
LDADERIGNGTAFLRARRASGFVYLNLYFLVGSSTSFGTGGFSVLEFELPSLFSTVNNQSFITPAYVAGTGSTVYGGIGLVTTGGGAYWSLPTLGLVMNTTQVTPSAPISLTNGCLLNATGIFEAYGN